MINGEETKKRLANAEGKEGKTGTMLWALKLARPLVLRVGVEPDGMIVTWGCSRSAAQLSGLRGGNLASRTALRGTDQAVGARKAIWCRDPTLWGVVDDHSATWCSKVPSPPRSGLKSTSLRLVHAPMYTMCIFVYYALCTCGVRPSVRSM